MLCPSYFLSNYSRSQDLPNPGSNNKHQRPLPDSSSIPKTSEASVTHTENKIQNEYRAACSLGSTETPGTHCDRLPREQAPS